MINLAQYVLCHDQPRSICQVVFLINGAQYVFSFPFGTYSEWTYVATTAGLDMTACFQRLGYLRLQGKLQISLCDVDLTFTMFPGVRITWQAPLGFGRVQGFPEIQISNILHPAFVFCLLFPVFRNIYIYLDSEKLMHENSTRALH